jgi:AraC-like DNA-binding protein
VILTPATQAPAEGIPCANAEKLLRLALAQGHEPQALCNDARVEFPLPESLDAATYSRLYGALAKTLNDECLGFYPDWKMPPGSFALLCRVMTACSSLQQALHEAGRFFEVLNGHKHSTLYGVDGDRNAWLSYPSGARRSANVFNRQNGIAGALSTYQRLCAWLVAQALPIRRVELCGPERVNTDKFQSIFQSQIHFGAAANRLYFDRACLQWPIRRDAQQLNSFLARAAYELIGLREMDANRNASLSHRLGLLMDASFATQQLTQNQAAQQLAMSARSLRRQLAEEHSSFQEIRDRHRFQQAETLLRHSKLNIAEIAERLGFDDASAFHRAFRRWTGTTPGRFRES